MNLIIVQHCRNTVYAHEDTFKYMSQLYSFIVLSFESKFDAVLGTFQKYFYGVYINHHTTQTQKNATKQQNQILHHHNHRLKLLRQVNSVP